MLSAVATELILQPPRYPLPTGSSSLIRCMKRPLQTPALLSLPLKGQQDHTKRPTCTDSFIGRETKSRRSRPPGPTPRNPHSRARHHPAGYPCQCTAARGHLYPRILCLPHGIERGAGVLLPDERNVAFRDLPGERLVGDAKIERLEPPSLSAVRRRVIVRVLNQPHHGLRISSAPKSAQSKCLSCCRETIPEEQADMAGVQRAPRYRQLTAQNATNGATDEMRQRRRAATVFPTHDAS